MRRIANLGPPCDLTAGSTLVITTVSHCRQCQCRIAADGKRGIMPKFVGTVQEFHHFIGLKVRNTVNVAARPSKIGAPNV